MKNVIAVVRYAENPCRNLVNMTALSPPIHVSIAKGGAVMTFAEIMDISKQIDRMADDLRSKLCEAVSKQPIKGKYLNDGKKGGPVIAIVKFSELCDNWSPEYHLPPAQARAVYEYMSKYQSAEGICSAVSNMLDNGYVIVGGDKTFLNEQTMDTIRKSERWPEYFSH